MVAGHLQEKKGYFYMVLSYPDAAGKRKTKWFPTGLPVKGNKKKAEKMLMETRQTFVPECKPIQDDLLQFNLIPHTFTGKKTRCYAIKKSDVIAFMNDREVNPEKYIAPKNWYKYGGEIVRPYKIRIQPPCAKDEKKLRRYYESKLAALPDVMDVAAAVDFTGYNRRTVCQWIRVGKLKALSLLQKYMIPKCYLIDWLCSDDYNNTNRKSRRHIDMLWEAQKWRD